MSYIITLCPHPFSCSRSVNPLLASNLSSLLPCSGIKVTGSSILFMETGIRRTSQQTRALNLKHEASTCCRFAFSGQMCNLGFQKGPETSNPSLRTKDNSLGCGITCVSHEKGDSLGSPWRGRAVLWAPPGGHRGAVFLCSLPLATLWLGPSYKNKEKYSDLFLWNSRKEVADHQEKPQQKRNKVSSHQWF